MSIYFLKNLAFFAYLLNEVSKMLYQEICLFIYGACLASFSFCYAQRYRSHLSILTPRSFCDTCQHQLTLWQVIPILGFCFQKGRCHFCHAKIPIQSTCLEIGIGLYLALLGTNLSIKSWPFILLLTTWCLCLSLQDFYTQSVASACLILGGILCLLCNLARSYHLLLHEWPLISIFLLFLGLLCYLGKLGSGDFYFIAFISLIIGFWYLLWVLLGACLLALGFCYVRQQIKIAFLPCLSLSLAILLLYLRFSN